MQQFFGHPEAPLFGVYQPPRGRFSNSDRAVLICPPIGQEYVQTHWALRLLAGQLTRKGIHTFRLDYHGIGDSSRSTEQIKSLSDWNNNIHSAIGQLKKLANVETVMLVGQRFGASLAVEVASQNPIVNSLVLWEPVLDGRHYLEGQRKMHGTMLDLWVCKMETPNDQNVEEILGSRYSRSLLDEVEQVNINVEEIEQPHLIVDVAENCRQFSHVEPTLQKVVIEEAEGTWNDLRVLETARLRPKTTRSIVSSIQDMFERLAKFEALSLVGEGVGQ